MKFAIVTDDQTYRVGSEYEVPVFGQVRVNAYEEQGDYVVLKTTSVRTKEPVDILIPEGRIQLIVEGER